MEETEGLRYGLRKRRKKSERPQNVVGVEELVKAAIAATAGQSRPPRILVFSGSGLSASSGMSTFSTKGGLYERAQRKFRLQDGKTLFTYGFFDKNRQEALAFLAEVFLEACQAQPAPGHHALASLARAGRLQRHYTLNIDGLAERAGMDTWHPTLNPNGTTVEMHGNIHHLVCVDCENTVPLTTTTARQLRSRKIIPCLSCSSDAGSSESGASALRFKVMMYEDADSEVITPSDVIDCMEEDTKSCDLVLWVGISFQQSASTAYFRKVRNWLREADRLDKVLQAVINPSEDALWNLVTACCNQQDLNVVEVLESSDITLPRLAEHLLNAKPKVENSL
jgi:NAD-dependent SIR2 family protein deacetylase